MDRTKTVGVSALVRRSTAVRRFFERKRNGVITTSVSGWGIGLAVIVSALLLATSSCGPKKKPIVIGSKDFTEQVVLGEIIAQHLEHRLTGAKIIRQLNLGGTLLAYQAMQNGQISLYPEYTGTIEAEILKERPANDPAQAMIRARQEMLRVARFELFDGLGFNNSFAMVIRGDDARKNKLETLSDAAKVKDGWKLGVGYEFQQRIDGMPALNEYQLPMAAPPRSMNLGLMYKALEQGQVSMIAANATDGPLAGHDWVILKDDKKVFGDYEACIMARQDALTDEPRLRPALAELSGKISNDAMHKLNVAVDIDHRQAREVAAEFLRNAGLSNR